MPKRALPEHEQEIEIAPAEAEREGPNDRGRRGEEDRWHRGSSGRRLGRSVHPDSAPGVTPEGRHEGADSNAHMVAPGIRRAVGGFGGRAPIPVSNSEAEHEMQRAHCRRPSGKIRARMISRRSARSGRIAGPILW